MNPQQTNVSLIGTKLFGDYTITRKLGEGGMGAVYLANQPTINQDIAIKVLHGKAAESDEIKERFNREARVISMLTHPNIIRVFIFGRTPTNLMYLAMEFVSGRSLRDELKLGLMDELVAIKIVKQMCSALAESHDLDIVHRDLKPDNVLLTQFRGENNFVKILDFGIAKITNSETTEKQLTQAGIVYGTPEYLSPEQAQAKDLDKRTDIYSIGVMLYEMMTGKVPFESTSAVQILTMHVFNDPLPPSKMASRPIAPTMENIIMKAMAKDPNHRFQNALEMFQALAMREVEILNERKMGPTANYVPGSELTGMFAPVMAAPAPVATLAPPGMHPQQATSLPQTAPQNYMQPGSTAAMSPPDNTRKYLKVAVGILLFMLIALIIVAAILLTK